MGVQVKMVTGDAIAIARETAATLGMGADILDAAGLGDVKQRATTAEGKSIEQADGFAQVFPEHKFHIVEVLQKLGHIVGMTGDGVNDAPALKKADCGIAVSGATDAARAAASIVLMSPGLSVIIEAIKESRKIFQRMNSYAIYRIAETLRVLLFVTLAILVFNFFPVTAIMIVMLALLNDGAILSIAYDNVHYRNRPEAWDMRLVLGMATVLGVVGPGGLWPLLPRRSRVSPWPSATADPHVPDALRGRTSDHLSGSHPRPVLVNTPRSNSLDGRARHADIGDAHRGLRALMTPLGWGWAALVWGYALMWFLVTDRVKLLAYRMLDPVKAAVLAGKPVPIAAAGAPSGGAGAQRPAAVAATAKVAPFHTDTDPAGPVYHDRSDCPYGQEIKANGNDKPGRAGRRRCNWCTHS